MGWKAKKIDIFDLKHRKLRPICMCLVCHSHGFAALKHCYCQPISMLLHEKQASKRVEKSAITPNILTHNLLQNCFIFPVFTASRDVVYKYAKGEEVFVKKKDNWNSTLSMDVLCRFYAPIFWLQRCVTRLDSNTQRISNLQVQVGVMSRSGNSPQLILLKNGTRMTRAESPKAYSPGQRPG